MENELQSFIKVWSTAIISLIYTYYLVYRLPKGLPRLVALLPALILFTILPFSLHSFHLGAPTAFFLLWLGNFKLLLFAFDLGPLSSHPPKSLTLFLTTASLPINVRRVQPSTTPLPRHISFRSTATLIIKVIFIIALLYLNQIDYKQILHPDFVLVIYCLHAYLGVETVLAFSAYPVKMILGRHFELDPQFNEPYLSTSLQDFWGRRWNLMVTTILRPAVYDPVRRFLTSSGVVGSFKTASLLAVVTTFAVSGLMHELIWYYFTRVSPTWEVTGFFVLNGVCTAAEAAAKRVAGGMVRLPAVVSTSLTLGFVALTAKWLFFPQLIRNGVDEWANGEYAPLLEFVKRTIFN